VTSIQKSVFTLLLLVAFFGAKHWLSVTQPDQQGCDTVKVIGGWQECRLVDRTAWFVGLRGCDGRDAHLYKVTGKLATGANAEAVVCCGAVFKGCTLRAAH
jgi:hypothetical protein